MAEFDIGFKIAAHHSGRALTRLANIETDKWEAISDTLQATERLADRAFRARHGKEQFVVYMEAYTRRVDSAVWSVLAKSGLLSERKRLPTRSLIFVLLPKGYREQHGQFRLAVGSETTQQVWFHEICMWKQDPQPWWEQNPGLMALYPLCRHNQDLVQAVTHAAAVIKHREMDSVRRADLLTSLSFFGRLKDRTFDFESIIGHGSRRCQMS